MYQFINQQNRMQTTKPAAAEDQIQPRHFGKILAATMQKILIPARNTMIQP